VTPDGLWFENHRWASLDEATQAQWSAEARRLLHCHADCLAVAVDCHF
jgi:hypothetical protein